MDAVFFIVIGAGLLLLLVPVRYLKSFKAAGFEFSLEQPHVQSAISGLDLDRFQNERIVADLTRLKDELIAVRGSRVLWIDDHPHTVVAERRLLRALGVDVVTASSSGEAERTLEGDNDFDLIITDVQREGDHFRKTGGIDIHDGVNFIVHLRKDVKDPVIANLPVIFYAAYDRERLVEFTAPARALHWNTEAANSEEDLIPTAVKLLAHSRSTPIVGREKKIPTGIRRRIARPPEAKPVEAEEPHEGEEEEYEEEEHFG
jgi:CheY-like chemotaxis protein